MIDNEIIKALECISGKLIFCQNCAYNKSDGPSYACIERAAKDALDLFNRLKAENDRLEKAGNEAVSCFNRMESLYNIKNMELKVAKAEAIEEFAERLKSKCDSPHWCVWMRDINDLVKEMVGENE
ncbi:MAG: hypothetical protein IJN75_04250 [Clostridia bacterium]|nr:hypothetical protein [Clostridia bacterium]